MFHSIKNSVLCSIKNSVLFYVFLSALISTTNSNTVRLVGGNADGEGYLEIKVNDQWLSVCAGNRGLAQAACRWDGYTSGREIRKNSAPQDNRMSWSFNVTCPSAARDFSTCRVGRCVGKRRMFLKCSGFPHCRMEDGTLIPGNSSLFVGNNKVCRCDKDNKVVCDCRNVEMKCKDGSRAKVDNQCRPTCSVDKTCIDKQVSSLCSYYKKNGQCANKTVQDICRNTCGVCDVSPTPTLSTECVDQYDSRICSSWRDLGGCARENVLEVCQESCGACEEDQEQSRAESDKEEVSTAATESEPDGGEKEDKDSANKSGDKVEEDKADVKGDKADVEGDKAAAEGDKADVEEDKDVCSDEYDEASCLIWRDNGYCASYESVRKRCRATCGVCQEECRDTLGETTCAAAHRYGSCSRNMKVLKGCAETCGLCDQITDANCTDLYRTETCKVWSRNGRCSSDKEVLKFCAKSCGVCTAAPTQSSPDSPTDSLEKVTGPCVDNSDQSLCSYYKSAGYCSKRQYIAAMRTQCRKTCELCGEECRDREKKKTCEIWRQGGHCETNWNLRERICPLTCGAC